LSFARAWMLVAVIGGGRVAVDPMRLAPPSAASVWDGGASSSASASPPADGGLQAALGPGAPLLGLPEPDRTHNLVALVDLAQRSNRLVQAVSRLEDVVRTYTGLLEKPGAAASRPVEQTG
jgi:hypothetical protein